MNLFTRDRIGSVIIRFFKIIDLLLHELNLGTVKQISEDRKDLKSDKKKKKSFWFEYAEDKGVNPHSSAWSEFTQNEKNMKRTKESYTIRFCSQCGGSLKIDSKFCQRCGHRIRSRQ